MRRKETGRGDGPLSAAPLPLLDSAYWTFCVSGTFHISLGCWIEQQKQILTPLSTSLLERHGDSSLHESNRNLALGVGWGKKSRRLWLLIWPFSIPLSSEVARTSELPSTLESLLRLQIPAGENLIGSVWVRRRCLGTMPLTRG